MSDVGLLFLTLDIFSIMSDVCYLITLKSSYDLHIQELLQLLILAILELLTIFSKYALEQKQTHFKVEIKLFFLIP